MIYQRSFTCGSLVVVTVLFNIVANAQHDSVEVNDRDENIQQLIRELNSDRYTIRENATVELTKQGSEVIDTLLERWHETRSPESRVRILTVLENVIPTIDWKTDSNIIKTLEKKRDESNDSLSDLITQFLGAAPDPHLADSLQALISSVVNQKEKTIKISDELLNQVKSSAAFQVIRRPPTRNVNKTSHWRRINDKTAHQEILLYRIRWFGGHWSSWMLPGVNDHHAKLNRQHWNCFYDHQHEFIQIMTKIGPKTTRDDFLAGKN